MFNNAEVTGYDVLQGIYRLANERPGIYARRDGSQHGGCVNTEKVDGKTVSSCIVGSFIIDILGVHPDDVTSGAWERTIDALEEECGFTFTTEAKYLLAMAQVMQDTRKISWEGIAEAIDEIRVLMNRYHSVRVADLKSDS